MRLKPGEFIALLQRNNPKEARRYIAWRTLRNALVAGRIVKPTICPLCGRETPARIMHAHHADYSKPLDVEWMCRDCHLQRHRELRRDAPAH